MRPHPSPDPHPGQEAPPDLDQAGTAGAIKPPPDLRSSELTGGGPIAKAVPLLRRRARRVLEAVVRATPPGAAKPWRTQRAEGHIVRLLEEGISEGDLLSHVAGCAELVRRGLEDPRWWAVGNLFGPKTLEVWRSQVAAMVASDERIERQRQHEQRQAVERDADLGRPLAVENLALRRLTEGTKRALQQGWWSDASTSEEAGEDAAEG